MPKSYPKSITIIVNFSLNEVAWPNNVTGHGLNETSKDPSHATKLTSINNTQELLTQFTNNYSKDDHGNMAQHALETNNSDLNLLCMTETQAQPQVPNKH